jgi:hypothetical protein
MIDSGLFVLPAFRAMLTHELGQTNDFGTVSWRGNNYLDYKNTNSSGGFGFAFPEKQSPTDGTSAQIRWCDWIAILLANEKHIPFFDPSSKIEKRDAEIKAAQDKLREK